MYNYNINIVLLYIIINIITLRVINHSIPQRMTLSTNIHLLDEMVASYSNTPNVSIFQSGEFKKKKKIAKKFTFRVFACSLARERNPVSMYDQT